MEQYGSPNHAQGSHGPHDSAMSVGSSSTTKGEDTERIRELEDEVKLLADRASAASQRYADYENEIRVLEAKLRQEQRKNSSSVEGAGQATGQPAILRPGISRFNSFMSTRKASPTGATTANGPSLPMPGREKELEEQLIKEQTARIAAENKAKEVSAEIEDLSATLFEQANEMVATERKQNSALKSQVQLLEEQQRSLGGAGGTGADEEATALRQENLKLKERLRSLQERDVQRTKRLQRLEDANRRIERVRAMLKPP